MPVVFVIDPDLPQDVQHDHAVVHVLRGRGRGEARGCARCAADWRMSGDASAAAKAAPLQVAKAVLLVVLRHPQARASTRRDAVTLKPVQVIVAGMIGAALFVLSLVVLVRFVIS